MKKEFDFEKVKKRMPYGVPPDFFDGITEQTKAEIERRNAVDRKSSFQFLWKAVSVAASIVALLTVGYILYTGSRQNTQPPTESIVSAPTPALDAGSITAGAEETPRPSVAATPPQTNSTKKADATAKKRPISMAAIDKPETLDEVLASIPDEELLLLAAVAASDLYVHEQTFE